MTVHISRTKIGEDFDAAKRNKFFITAMGTKMANFSSYFGLHNSHHGGPQKKHFMWVVLIVLY